MLEHTTLLMLLSLVAPALTQNVYMCGDSTMAEGGGGGSLLEGWGTTLSTHISLPITNFAKGGRSARSFTVESRFDNVTALVNKGDYVIISFGKNDGGSLLPTDNLRTPCPGTGSETCISTNPKADPSPILTFSAYLLNAGNAIVKAGGIVIFSSPIPNNLWEEGTFEYVPSRFTTYTEAVAKLVQGALYVDHAKYWADVQESEGREVVDGWYPVDHTHPSIEGAKRVEQAFVRSLKCTADEAGLAKYVVGDVDGAGDCL